MSSEENEMILKSICMEQIAAGIEVVNSEWVGADRMHAMALLLEGNH